jgi:hypothetical protein
LPQPDEPARLRIGEIAQERARGAVGEGFGELHRLQRHGIAADDRERQPLFKAKGVDSVRRLQVKSVVD